jgi:hypothetical protein
MLILMALVKKERSFEYKQFTPSEALEDNLMQILNRFSLGYKPLYNKRFKLMMERQFTGS